MSIRLGDAGFDRVMRVDVVSDAITVMRMGLPHSSRTIKVAPWGVRFLSSDGAGFHVVLQGACWLIPTEGEPILLRTGDVAFLSSGRAHGLCDSLDTPLVDVSPTALVEFGNGSVLETNRVEDDRDATVLLCGAYRVDRGHVHPLLAELPEVVHLPARVGQHPSLRATVDMLGAELETRRPGADAIVTALLDALLLYIVRAWVETCDEPESATGWTAALRDTAIHSALRGRSRRSVHALVFPGPRSPVGSRQSPASHRCRMSRGGEWLLPAAAFGRLTTRCTWCPAELAIRRSSPSPKPSSDSSGCLPVSTVVRCLHRRLGINRRFSGIGRLGGRTYG
jgi:hypothetical protein